MTDPAAASFCLDTTGYLLLKYVSFASSSAGFAFEAEAWRMTGAILLVSLMESILMLLLFCRWHKL